MSTTDPTVEQTTVVAMRKPALSATTRKPAAKRPAAAKTPQPKPEPQPEPQPQPKATTKPVATAGVQAFPRHWGQITMGAGRNAKVTVEPVKNGHITPEPAERAAAKMAKTAGKGAKPSVLIRDRYQATVTLSDGQVVTCDCKFGHRDLAAARTCSATLANKHGHRLADQQPAK